LNFLKLVCNNDSGSHLLHNHGVRQPKIKSKNKL